MYHDLINWYWEEHRALQDSHPRMIEPLLREKESAIFELREQLGHTERSYLFEEGDSEVSLSQLDSRIRKLEDERYEIRHRLLVNSQRNSDEMNHEGLCQCATENAIGHSSDPDRMRAFLIIAVLVDQMMWTHFLQLYGKFEGSGFVFPKLFSHLTYGSRNMARADWFVYSHHGYDKKVNWEVTEEIAEILLNGLYSWFDQIVEGEKKRGFQQILEDVIREYYEPVNSDRLIPIVSKLVKPSDAYESDYYRQFLIKKI